MTNPDPIPLYLGDDWSLAFSLREAGGNGAPVDLTGAQIVCDLFVPGSAIAIELAQASGQATIVDAAAGQFAVGVPRALSAGFIPTATPGPATLALAVDQGGIRRTIGVRTLVFLDRRTPAPAPLVNLDSIDPVTGQILQFDGWATFVPSLVASGSLVFAADLGQSLLP